MPESLVFVCSFDQAGNIRDGRASIAVQFNDANDRIERGERIGRHLWMRGGDLSEQGALSRVGITYQTCIGDRPKFQGKPSLLARFPSVVRRGTRFVELLK